MAYFCEQQIDILQIISKNTNDPSIYEAFKEAKFLHSNFTNFSSR